MTHCSKLQGYKIRGKFIFFKTIRPSSETSENHLGMYAIVVNNALRLNHKGKSKSYLNYHYFGSHTTAMNTEG